jgi:FKBP-type peptidyl-prolyl cis-trans isomerase
MSIGEVAKLTCPPDYAYGKKYFYLNKILLCLL